MSRGPAAPSATNLGEPCDVASSAVIVGTALLGDDALIAEGVVLRSANTQLTIGAGSAGLENSVVVASAAMPTTAGRRTVFGHRCLVIGTTIGDLCESGNASILMPGARLGD